MTKGYTVEEAGARLPELLEEAASHFVPIMQGNQTVAFLVTPGQWETWLETAEVLADPEAMETIRRYEAGESKMLTQEEVDAIWDAADKEAGNED